MIRKFVLTCFAAVTLCAGTVPAFGLPIVELKADGPYPNPHDITVAPGTPVRLEYTLSDPDHFGHPDDPLSLLIFQNNLSVTGDTTVDPGPPPHPDLTATHAGTWWGAQSGTSLKLQYQAASGMFILLGEAGPFGMGPPIPLPDVNEVSLASVNVVPLSGTVTVDLLSLGDPVAINLWLTGDSPPRMAVDLVNSLPVVTIRVGDQQDVIPEPASALLLALGLGRVWLRRRRRA